MDKTAKTMIEMATAMSSSGFETQNYQITILTTLTW